MNKMMMIAGVSAIAACLTGCMTKTHRYATREDREQVAGFAEDDANSAVSKAVQSLLSQDRIRQLPGSQRAVMVVEDLVVDTNSRGRDAGPLAESIGQSLREELTNSGKVIVFDKEAARYATVRVTPQYQLKGRLTERVMRQDDGDVQKEYNVNLTLVDLATGLQFWQKRIHIGKLVDKENVNN